MKSTVIAWFNGLDLNNTQIAAYSFLAGALFIFLLWTVTAIRNRRTLTVIDLRGSSPADRRRLAIQSRPVRRAKVKK